MNLPKRYAHLDGAVGPRILIEAMKFYGLKEFAGAAHNPVILGWAKELGLTSVYNKDETPWCALFMAICLKRAGLSYPRGVNALRALQYATHHYPVLAPMLGDILIFTREGGGHVGLYVGEDSTHYHVLGGNQKDSVSIVRISKDRLTSARRTTDEKTAYIRRVILDPQGDVTINEA